MTTTKTSRTVRRLRSVLAGTVALLAATAARANVPVEPIRRDARIEVERFPFAVPPATTPPFVFASFVIPISTTADLAEFSRTAGGPAAAAWLCDAYADAPAFDPDAASFRGLIEAASAVDDIGRHAADALVCPIVRTRLRQTVTKVTDDCSSFFDCKTVTYTIVSHQLAHAGCTEGGAERHVFDGATCRRVLLGSSGRAFALRVFSRRAGRVGGCLELRIDATGAALYARRRACE
jgi:hypothetical protein